MKKFLSKVLFISLVILIIFIAFECLALTFINEYSYKKNYLEEKGKGIKVLILGHSHSAKGINPEVLGDSVFNMAISGRAHYYDAVLTERYLSKLKNLRCVIWPLGYAFEYYSYIYKVNKKCSTNSTIPIYQCMYEKYMNISYEPFIPYQHWSLLVVHPHSFIQELSYEDFERKNGCNRLGYEKKLLSERHDNWQESMLPSSIDYSHPDTPKARQEGINNFKRIAAACRNANVRLVVISTPCYRTYRERMTERGKREMRECVDSMRSVYPAMEYYNFIADSRFTDDDFFDASHVCDQGAEKLSKILKDTLNL